MLFRSLDGGLKVRTLMLPDEFLDHGDPDKVYAAIGLDATGIVRRVFEALGRGDLSDAARRA